MAPPETPEMDLGRSGSVETVTQFTRRIKTLLEGGLRASWIRGEVSNLRAQASGHVYFSLKDGGAQLSAVRDGYCSERPNVPMRGELL